MTHEVIFIHKGEGVLKSQLGQIDFFQGDYLYTETLNKNEFVKRIYDNGDIINSQLKRNRNTHFTTLKSGIDYLMDDQNTFTFSGLFGSEKIIDRGDQPFFNENLTQRKRLWQFLEDELKVPISILSVGPDRTQTIIR